MINLMRISSSNQNLIILFKTSNNRYSTVQKILVVPEQHKLSVIIRKQQSRRELLQYFHATCLSPVKSTWLKAIKTKNFESWPGIIEENVSKYLHLSTATVQGHIHWEQQNQASTKITTSRMIAFKKASQKVNLPRKWRT